MNYSDEKLISLIEAQLYQAEGSDFSDDEMSRSR